MESTIIDCLLNMSLFNSFPAIEQDIYLSAPLNVSASIHIIMLSK